MRSVFLIAIVGFIPSFSSAGEPDPTIQSKLTEYRKRTAGDLKKAESKISQTEYSLKRLGKNGSPKQREKLERTLRDAEEEKLLALYPLVPNSKRLQVGDFGILATTRMKVFEIVDKDEFLIDYEFTRGSTQFLLLKGYGTKDVATGINLKFQENIHVSETRKIGTYTVVVVEPLDVAAYEPKNPDKKEKP